MLRFRRFSALLLAAGLMAGCQQSLEAENARLLEENRALREALEAQRSAAEPEAALPEPRRYAVESGDTLSAIALKFYGRASQWPLIYQANRGAIGSSQDRLKVGTELIIPPLDETSKRRNVEIGRHGSTGRTTAMPHGGPGRFGILTF